MLGRRTMIGGAIATAAAGRPGAKVPTLGMILPAQGQGVPEALAMYPRGVRFISTVAGLQSMTREGYEGVVDRIVPAACELAAQGAEAVALMGTSLSFFNGAAFNKRLRERMAEAAGVPAMTMTDAVIDGLRRVRARRIIAATAYGDEVNGQLRAYLEAAEFEVALVRGLGITSLGGGALDAVTPAMLVEFGAATAAAAPGADALLVSCGGLRTLEVVAPLEQRSGLPVVSSFPHAVEAAVRMLGLDARLAGHGTLLARG